jgi:hypothetical protein
MDGYAIELDERILYGVVVGPQRTVGFFSLATLRAIRWALGLPVERDLYFEPTPLAAL